MKRTAIFLLSLLVLSLASCGGENGGAPPSPQPVSVSISPISATVEAGATMQFTATVQNTTNTAVTWQVNGIEGGNTTLGTISTGGLYSAPLAIPASGMVTVRAVSQADTTKSDSADVTIVFSDAVLNGQYAFSYTGYDPYIFFVGGSFIADGNGSITSGLMDLNHDSGVFSELTLSGTYIVNPDGRAEILLTDSESYTYTLRTVLISPDRAHLIQFDTFAGGQGYIDKQDPAAFEDSAFAGGYAFRFMGLDDVGDLATAGRFSADGTRGISAGVMDVNDGADVSAESFTGTYAIASSGRGTASLDTTMGPMSFAFYMVSASKAYFVSLDYVPALIGTAEKQTLETFSDADVSGNYAFLSGGFSSFGFLLTAGRFTADGAGNVSAGVLDENDEGVLEENLAFTGTYSVAANGRGTAAFTSTRGTSNYAFYMISPSRAVFVQLDTFAVATGELEAQQGGPFSTASIAGDYGFSLTGSYSDIVGQLRSDGGGGMTGTADINDVVEGPFPDIPFTATYSVSANGRGSFVIDPTVDPTNFYLYVISESKAILLGADLVIIGIAEKQF